MINPIRPFLFGAALAATAESATYVSKVSHISNSWCNTNCNWTPPNCPSSYCKLKTTSTAPAKNYYRVYPYQHRLNNPNTADSRCTSDCNHNPPAATCGWHCIETGKPNPHKFYKGLRTTDDWCYNNCNNVPPYCPAGFCQQIPSPGAPTRNPTPYPTRNPTPYPTQNPTLQPTRNPTPRPTPNPTPNPTQNPTPEPTVAPTTAKPTPVPTSEPTLLASDGPSLSLAPSNKPTPVPTMAPTAKPTLVPTSAPTAKAQYGTLAPATFKTLSPEAPTATSNGDPHFKTWKNEHFEYHGQCDMILVKDETFANGIGLEVQIRTKLVRFWSYIRSVSVRIGDDILEIEGSADTYPFPSKELLYWINLEYQGELKTLGGFPVKSWRHGKLRQHFVIDLGTKFPGEEIEIATFREFIRVDFKNGSEESFGNAAGLLGDFKTGKTLARDGVTTLNDFYDYGSEWQVLPSEHMLFHDVAHPQFPQKCIEPEDPRGDRRRRLDESTVSEVDAEKACAFIKDPLDRKDCVYDILATQDLGMVGAY